MITITIIIMIIEAIIYLVWGIAELIVDGIVILFLEIIKAIGRCIENRIEK